MLFHVLIFQSNDDSVINQGRIIHTGTVYACTYSADYNESVLCLFIFLWLKEISVSVVGDSIYPEVTRYTLKWGSKKTLSNYRFIKYRLNLSHIFVHSHCLLPFNTKQSIKTFIIFSNALKM